VTFDDLYARDVMPVGHTVCGMQMQVMAVGHARILTAMDAWSPRTSHEVLLSAFVCSRPPSRFSRNWGKRRFLWALRFWSWRLGKRWDYLASIKAWAEYVDYHQDEPAAVFESSDKARRTPLLDAMKAALCRYSNYDPMTFDEVPLSQAKRDYCSLAELEGTATVVNMSLSQARSLGGG
jgi:hypothetical protein